MGARRRWHMDVCDWRRSTKLENWKKSISQAAKDCETKGKSLSSLSLAFLHRPFKKATIILTPNHPSIQSTSYIAPSELLPII